jgi:hypothetical protein
MAARLSTLGAGRFLPTGRFLVLISVRGWGDPRAIVRLQGLGTLKKSTSSGTRTGDLPACSIVLRYRVPPGAFINATINYWVTKKQAILYLFGFQSTLTWDRDKKQIGQSLKNYIVLQIFPVDTVLNDRPWRPTGLWDMEAPTFSRQSAHRWRWVCQPNTPTALYPQEDSWYSFLL